MPSPRNISPSPSFSASISFLNDRSMAGLFQRSLAHLLGQGGGDYSDGGAGGRRASDRAWRQLRRREAPAERACEDGPPAPDAARLGRREHAAIEPADHQHEQQQRRPHLAQGGEALAPRAAPPGRKKV